MKATQRYKFAAIATDVVVFTLRNNEPNVLLIKMKKKPYSGFWAAPGGLVLPRESVDASAKRILRTKAGLSNVYLEQVYTFGGVNRDPFGRVVSVAYMALIPFTDKILTTPDHDEIAWFSVRSLPKLAYDHREIISTSFKRLQAKLEYTNIVFSLLPKDFTLSEMQIVYESILGKTIDKRNFRKKILSLGIVKSTGSKRAGEANRPAKLYSFVTRKQKVVDIL